MLRVQHPSCGYFKEFEFLCPKCGLPFCEEDMDQSTGGLLLNTVLAKIDADEAKRVADLLQIQVTNLSVYTNVTVKNKINEIVAWCNNHKKPHDADILPL